MQVSHFPAQQKQALPCEKTSNSGARYTLGNACCHSAAVIQLKSETDDDDDVLFQLKI